MWRTNRVGLIVGVCAVFGMMPAWAAHPHHDRAAAPQAEHGHTHLAVDYSFMDERGAYPEPVDAGDGHFWFRGNLHTHTLWSDGDQFPEVVTQWYVEHGYHFLALSDHNILSRGERWIDPETNPFLAGAGRMEAVGLYRERFGDGWVQTREAEGGGLEVRLKPLSEFRHLFERAGRFILIEAEEITEGRHAVHVNATNVAELIEPRTGGTVEETIRLNVDAVLEQGEALGRAVLPHLNHPNWQWAVTAEDMIPVENLRFFEVYNGHRGVNNLGGRGRKGLERVWDIVLAKRLSERGLGVVYGLAVDDAHHYEESTSDVARPGRGWVMVRSRFLTPEHLIAALEAGDFYATTGVRLRSVGASGEGLAIEIEPEEGVTYTTEFIGTREGYDPESSSVFGPDGERLRTTRRYSAAIGEVLARVEGTTARYGFEGDEIYVRARVTSSRAHPNPFAEGEREQAWVQPVVPGR